MGSCPLSLAGSVVHDHQFVAGVDGIALVDEDFLSGNLIPYLWLDVESSTEGKELIRLNSIEVKELPVFNLSFCL